MNFLLQHLLFALHQTADVSQDVSFIQGFCLCSCMNQCQCWSATGNFLPVFISLLTAGSALLNQKEIQYEGKIPWPWNSCSDQIPQQNLFFLIDLLGLFAHTCTFATSSKGMRKLVCGTMSRHTYSQHSKGSIAQGYYTKQSRDRQRRVAVTAEEGKEKKRGGWEVRGLFVLLAQGEGSGAYLSPQSLR